MTLNSKYENCIGGKKLETRRKPLKACANKKKVKLPAEPLIQLDRKHREFFHVCPTCKRVNPPKVENFPLTEEERTSWLEFKKLDEGRPVHETYSGTKCSMERGLSVEVNHSFVSVLLSFATDAYNAIIHMYDKENRNCIRHSEVTSCVCDNLCKYHYFYLNVEAIEDAFLGVYDVIVACNRIDGSMSLVHFILTDERPSAGKIAMMLPQLDSLRSEYKSMKGMEQDIKIKLENSQKSIKGKKNKDGVQLEKEHNAIKDKCKTLYQHIQSQIPKTWIERRACRFGGGNAFATGLKPRIRGLDYYTRSFEFQVFAICWH